MVVYLVLIVSAKIVVKHTGSTTATTTEEKGISVLMNVTTIGKKAGRGKSLTNTIRFLQIAKAAQNV
jgi:hypothetical protein